VSRLEKARSFESLIDSGFVPRTGATAPQFSEQIEQVLTGGITPDIFFQPIVDLRRGAVSGYEALARFPRELNLAPDIIFQRAGKLGMRMELEHLVCSLVLKNRSKLPEGCFLTMNLGPDFLLSDQWQQLLASESDLAGVVIEITEETSISNYDEIRERSGQIRSRGGLVAVDDAGSGYASLQHILELRPDFIKLNRNFVLDCHVDRAKSTMIEMMGAAADRLDAWVIAEGVETVQELEELVRIGVPLAQGYLLARPESEMHPLTEQVAAELHRASRMNRQKTLEPHITPCGMSVSIESASELLQKETEHSVAVVLDRRKRPVHMIERHPHLGIRMLENFTRTQISSPPRQVLYRALARAVEVRFDPLVVVNNEGECVGTVTIDRLMSSVLTLEAQRIGL
jgi:EAL domain-containing protein (putative c-di-GMP-specific phosphodiesterase class I)